MAMTKARLLKHDFPVHGFSRKSFVNFLVPNVQRFRREKKSKKINSLGPETPRGGLPREGVGVEKFVPSLESLFSLGFEGGNGDVREFCRDVPDPGGVQKGLCKKSSCAFSFPKRGLCHLRSLLEVHKRYPPKGHHQILLESWISLDSLECNYHRGQERYKFERHFLDLRNVTITC